MDEPQIDRERANQFLSRAIDFTHGAATLCGERDQGWLPSSAMLVAQALELLAKRRLLLSGKSMQVLRRPPYGHDLRRLCGAETGLRNEASEIAAEYLLNPSPNGVDEGFDFDTHFDALADAHSAASDYSLRYHQGIRSFANPNAMTVIVGEIVRRERMRG
ncbi:MAG: hypothetical protein ACMUJJ_01025 [Roseicyclus sp.]|uniref:hypothetical protein n=1 Tax=Roseicyclus sp. TaxID=1914329 RepID=UPI003A85A5B2